MRQRDSEGQNAGRCYIGSFLSFRLSVRRSSLRAAPRPLAHATHAATGTKQPLFRRVERLGEGRGCEPRERLRAIDRRGPLRVNYAGLRSEGRRASYAATISRASYA
jgi:hypothetical protein